VNIYLIKTEHSCLVMIAV